MTEKNKNLLIRVLSALVLLPLVLWLVWRGGFYTAGLISATAAACAWEYYSIVEPQLTWAHWVGVLVTALWPLYAAWSPTGFSSCALWTLAGMFLFAWIFYLLRGPLPSAPVHAAQLVMGMLYGGLGLMALSALRQKPDGLVWVIAALVITWANDTLAYFAGRFLGRHKLYPAVSPNKTWEGFAGGMVGSVVGMFITRAGFFPALSAGDCIILGLGGGVLGPLGDLCESMLKRAYQKKDSSALIPGHGGFLDRVDALIFNAPWVFVYVTFLRSHLSF